MSSNRTHGMEYRRGSGGAIDPIEREAMQMNIQIDGQARSGLALDFLGKEAPGVRLYQLV